MTEQEQMHEEYEQSLIIHAPPDLIFDFVADVRNLPKYLPTTKHAEPQQGERVRVQGEAAGHHYDSDGFMRADRHAYRLEWGADERYYSGYLQITPEGANAANVTVHLAFRGHPPGADPSDAPSRADINEGIMKSLQSIENQVTGTGGKEEPSVAT